MSFYILPALIALVIKLSVIIHARHRNSKNASLIRLIIFFAFLNLVECLLLAQIFNEAASSSIMRAYYILTILCVTYMAMYIARISQIKMAIISSRLTAVFAIGLSCTVLLSDLIISGVQSIGYSYTATRGNYYTAYHIYTTAIFGFMLLIATVAWKFGATNTIRRQSLVALIAFTPIALVGMLVTLLMLSGFKVNASMLIPLATSLSLIILLKTEIRSQSTNIMMYLPFSPEKKLAKKLFDVTSRHSNGGVSIKESRDEIEKLLLIYSMSKNDNVVSKAARDMSMKRTTIYSALKRHAIEIEKD